MAEEIQREENKKSETANREERVLEFWKENKIFEKSLEARKGEKEFIFYEGPPTANAKPALHHLEARSFKDAIPRYKTMRGYHVRRKGGWDTHGLPVELQVEKALGLKSKKDIEKYGIEAFNKKCKDSVFEYIGEWTRFTDRIGYWVDKEHPYITYENPYIESLWNIVKKIHERDLLYKDYKVVPWCPRCGTALSSHELAQGYEDVKDLSVTAKFKVTGPSENSGRAKVNTYLLAWTTTPWTLPGNAALAVGKDIDYVKIKVANEANSEIYILAKERLSIITEPYEIQEDIKGKDFVGLSYEPLYPFLTKNLSPNEKLKLEKAFKVYAADFVTTSEGTGIVHTAVMYGQDDFELGTKIGLPKHHLVNPEGKFVKGTGFLEGRYVKEVDEKGKPTLAVDIIEDLSRRNLLFKKENYEHPYPHCWRCHTPLIYYARDSWYIKMSDPKIKKELIAQNQEINWEPAYTRDGRFGQWLSEIKDWAVSRERYWGTPLPVWVCETCKKTSIIGSIAELKERTKKSGNKYFVMRHGGTEANMKDIISFEKQASDKLTKEGREQVEIEARQIIDKKIDLIIASPFARTAETAEIVKEKLGLKDNQVILDKRLQEIDAGDFDGKSWDEYHRRIVEIGQGWFSRKITEGESLQNVAKRTGEVLYELEHKYKDKNILIVTHGGPAWLLFVNSGLYIPENKPYKIPAGVDSEAFVPDFKRFLNAEVRALPFNPLPHNENYELDLHRPYIDEVSLACDNLIAERTCGGHLIRTKEVMDVWFDSGAMPFAQDHYPFENKKWVDGEGYPADFISEAIDQTRGWFYTLHAVGILMGRGKAYKNVICLGHLLDAAGKKMSKSLGNIVDPWIMMDKYGVDTLRLWMYSVNQPGESKNFDEKTVALLQSQVFGLLYNVLAFYELYRDKKIEENTVTKSVPKSKNILDIWILARLDELIETMTKNLDTYKLLEPVRAVKDFVGDLSTWYLRRSRERIKDGDKDAKQTLYLVLKNLAKLLAPFAPFAADDIWLKLKNKNDAESVHLEKWPESNEINNEIIEEMKQAREIVTYGLEARQKENVKIKQPLNNLKIKQYSFQSTSRWPDYVEILQAELNVKNIDAVRDLGDLKGRNVILDTTITSELKAEGDYRELVRALQDMRKKVGLTPSDVVSLLFETDDVGRKLIERFEKDMKKTVLVSKIEFKKNIGEEIKINNFLFKVEIKK